MRNTASGLAVASHIEITSSTVRRGDVIQIGGRLCRVVNLVQLPGGAKQLLFESGELLTMHSRSRFTALRMRLMQRGGDQFRGLSSSRHRR
ncbi:MULTISPECIES: hypothetical protein [unclassified Streptomyces]|uniref:hypothetical protein n=1 Tax=unclassified Streptomyces TaxID=2593676 RepID=UPI0016617CFC|nr:MULTISPECIES: hypothetical protein [unclassified Streptomyces]